MARRRRVEFKLDTQTGQLVSRCGSEFAWPILEYEKIGQDGDFSKPLTYKLEKIPVLRISAHDWEGLVPIGPGKLTPTQKNPHREFWGLKPLKETA